MLMKKQSKDNKVKINANLLSNTTKLDNKLIDALSKDVLVKNIKKIQKRLLSYKQSRGVINQMCPVERLVDNQQSIKRGLDSKNLAYQISDREGFDGFIKKPHSSLINDISVYNLSTVRQSLPLNGLNSSLFSKDGQQTLRSAFTGNDLNCQGYLTARSSNTDFAFAQNLLPLNQQQNLKLITQKQQDKSKIQGYVNFDKFVSREKTSYLAQIGSELQIQAKELKDRRDNLKIKNFMLNYYQDHGQHNSHRQLPQSKNNFMNKRYSENRISQNPSQTSRVQHSTNPIQHNQQELLQNQLRDKIYDVKCTPAKRGRNGLGGKKSSRFNKEDPFEFQVQSEQINIKEMMVDKGMGISKQLSHLKNRCLKINL
eukprot:403376140